MGLRLTRHEAKDDENNVCNRAVSRLDDFQKGMRIRSAPLEFNGQCCEEEDLDRRARCVPEWAGDSVSIADTRTLQQGCRPGP